MFRLTVSSLLLLLLFGGTLHCQELKVGVINSEVVVQNYPEFRRAEAQLGRDAEGLQAERANWEEEMSGLQKLIEEKEEKLRTGENTLSGKRKQELQADIDSLKLDFNERFNLRMQYEQERLNQRRTELMGQILEVVNKAIEEIGQQDNFDLIIDSSNGTVVYARNPEDLTDKLLQSLGNR